MRSLFETVTGIGDQTTDLAESRIGDDFVRTEQPRRSLVDRDGRTGERRGRISGLGALGEPLGGHTSGRDAIPLVGRDRHHVRDFTDLVRRTGVGEDDGGVEKLRDQDATVGRGERHGGTGLGVREDAGNSGTGRTEVILESLQVLRRGGADDVAGHDVQIAGTLLKHLRCVLACLVGDVGRKVLFDDVERAATDLAARLMGKRGVVERVACGVGVDVDGGHCSVSCFGCGWGELGDACLTLLKGEKLSLGCADILNTGFPCSLFVWVERTLFSVRVHLAKDSLDVLDAFTKVLFVH